MVNIPLPLENVSLELASRWAYSAGNGVLAGLFLLLPVFLVLVLSRYELRLVRPRLALTLLALRLTVLGVLWFVVALQPTLTRTHTEEVPGQVTIAVDLSRSMDVADLDHKDGLTRRQLARKVLIEDGLLGRLAARHKVTLFGFHRDIWEVNTEHPDELFASRKADDNLATNLDLPLQRGAEKAGDLLGLVLLSDGQHNQGPSPLEHIKDFARPIYAVGLGSKQAPPDVAVVEMKAPDNAFKDTEVQVEARIKSTGLPAQDLVVELAQNGKVLSAEHKKVLKPGQERVRFQVKLEDLGTHQFEVKVRPTLSEPAEITLANNSMTRTVRVSQDRAQVLVIEEDARWEFHFLANALLRDRTPQGEPTLQVERVLFSQPRLGLISEEDLEKMKNPLPRLPVVKDNEQADPLFRFDVIILGDVAPERLSVADRRRLERYVAQRGGTLVLHAGRRFWPLEYVGQAGAGDPLLKMLPVSGARALQSKPGFVLGLTTDGQEKSFLQMENEPGKNQRFWAEMPRHFWGVVGRAKPAATVLAYATETPLTPADRDGPMKDQALFVLMPFGFGQVFHVGLDSTWRWRYRVGDDYHHHFWGQLVRWAAADRLLPAGNRFVRFGTRAPVYLQGKDVEIAVRLSDEAGLLPSHATPAARVLRILADGKEERQALVPLRTKENQVGELQGAVKDLPPGRYRIELEIPDLAKQLDAPADPKDGPLPPPGSDSFTVLPREDGEMLDLSANWPLLATLAQESRGDLFTADTAGDIVDRLAQRTTWRETTAKERLWQDAPLVWWTLAILLTLLTVEWVLRKAAGLP